LQYGRFDSLLIDDSRKKVSDNAGLINQRSANFEWTSK